MSDTVSSYLKKHAEALVKDIGIERAAALSGKSKATLGRYYSEDAEHADRFMPIDVAARLEAEASFPHVTHALAELAGFALSLDASQGSNRKEREDGAVNTDVVALSQRFAMLMAEYQESILDGKITVNEAKRLLTETRHLQQVLVDMKLHLENETVR